MTQRQCAKTAAAQEEDGESAWRDAQVFAAMTMSKLAAQAAVQVLAQVIVQHWMNHHHCQYHHQSQMSHHLQIDVTHNLKQGKTETRQLSMVHCRTTFFPAHIVQMSQEIREMQVA